MGSALYPRFSGCGLWTSRSSLAQEPVRMQHGGPPSPTYRGSLGLGPSPRHLRSPPGDRGTLLLENHLSLSFGLVSNHALSFPVRLCPPSSWGPRGQHPCLCVSLWHLPQVSAWGVGCPGVTHQCVPPLCSVQAGGGWGQGRGGQGRRRGPSPCAPQSLEDVSFLEWCHVSSLKLGPKSASCNFA